PHRLTWGFAYSMPFGLMAMLATMLGLIFTSERKPIPRTIEVFLLGALWLWFVITTIFAFYPDDAAAHLLKVSKILFGIVLSMVLLQEARKVRALVWVIALSIGFYGFKGGVWAILTGGGNRVLGRRTRSSRGTPRSAWPSTWSFRCWSSCSARSLGPGPGTFSGPGCSSVSSPVW